MIPRWSTGFYSTVSSQRRPYDPGEAVARKTWEKRMADLSGAKSQAAKFIANGGGAVTFRLLSTAMGLVLLALMTWGLNAVASRFDRIDGALDKISQRLADTSTRVDVHANRLDHIDLSETAIWTAVHADALRLDDHEKRLSHMEGEFEPRRN